MKFQKIKLNKETLLLYWKKGWKVWLMVLCCSFAVAIVALPIMIPLAMLVAFLNIEINGNIVPFILSLTIVPPTLYYIFTLFYEDK